MQQNKNKEKTALLIGFALIILVMLITLLRGNIFSDKKYQNDSSAITRPQHSKYQNYKTITAKDLQKEIVDNKAGTIIDIRPFEDYAKEHITDSINITPEEFSTGSKVDAHDSVTVIGKNSTDDGIEKVVESLKKEGVSNIRVLSGGMEAWERIPGPSVTYGNPNSFADQSKVSYVDPEKLNEAITKKIPVFVVDVREKESYIKGHIPGSINVPFEELEKRRSEISENRVVVVGENELQEFQAAVRMYDMLTVSPYVMRGAMPKWEEKRFELAK